MALLIRLLLVAVPLTLCRAMEVGFHFPSLPVRANPSLPPQMVDPLPLDQASFERLV